MLYDIAKQALERQIKDHVLTVERLLNVATETRKQFERILDASDEDKEVAQLLYRKRLLEYANDKTLPYNKTGCLKYLPLQIDARYMITSNLDTSDGLVNGSSGFLKQVDLGYPKKDDNDVRKPSDLSIYVY